MNNINKNYYYRWYRLTVLVIGNRTPILTFKFLDDDGNEDDFTSGMDREASTVVVDIYFTNEFVNGVPVLYNTYTMTLKSGFTATYQYIWLGSEFVAKEGEFNAVPRVTFVNYAEREYPAVQWESKACLLYTSPSPRDRS